LFPVIWIECRGFVVELRRMVVSMYYDESKKHEARKRRSGGNGRRKRSVTAVEYELLASCIWDIPG
jgi:hypothetical protein